MGRMQQIRGLALLAVLACGCSSELRAPQSVDHGGAFELRVAPWEIDSFANFACYSIEVSDAKGDVVWARDNLCTDEFGLGVNGTLSYVGVCDAGPTGSSTNSVSISLTRLVGDDGSDLGNWDKSPPTFRDDFVCNANADAIVRAAFVVITQGAKGFLDVSVEVNEVACNAKVDCRQDFLSTGAEAGPEGSIVLALGCDTSHLYMDDVTLTCRDELDVEVSVTVDPGDGPGTLEGFPDGLVFGAIRNAGAFNDGESSFWTLAIGVSSAGIHDCHLSARMTANNGDFGNNDVYPTIVASVPFGFGEDGAFDCTNPLDGVGSDVVTDWDDDTDYDNCLEPDTSTPDDLNDVIVGDCLDGGTPNEDACPEGQSDPDGVGACTPIEGRPCGEGTEDPDGDGVCTPIEDDEGCTRPQGYWYTHADISVDLNLSLGWPAPEDESTLICGVTWYSVLASSPVGGDVWTILATQWIAARLNVASGASVPDDVNTAMAEAETLLTASCDGILLTDVAYALELELTLELYNTGMTGPGHCE